MTKEKEQVTKKDGKKSAKRYQQGVFVAETTLANPNGSFNDNRPRFDIDKLYTTDKAIKYNVRNYLDKFVEENGKDNDLNLFYIKRKADESEPFAKDYKTKQEVIEDVKEEFDDFRDAFVNKHIDVRMFGATLAVKGEDNTMITGPVQLSYGIDIIGGEIKEPQIGTPFPTEDDEEDSGGGQTTLGKDRMVDHAVMTYDISVNPKNAVHPETSESILRKKDLEYLKRGLIFGTNMRKTTSKNTNSKLLLFVKFKDGEYLNIGELKRLVQLNNSKFNKQKEVQNSLEIDLTRVYQKLKPYLDQIDSIEIYKDTDVTLTADWDDIQNENSLKNKIQKNDFVVLLD